jgi:hypothetical protein
MPPGEKERLCRESLFIWGCPSGKLLAAERTPKRVVFFCLKKGCPEGQGAPCKQVRGINAQYPSKHHRKLVWKKLANDYLTLTFSIIFLQFMNYCGITDKKSRRRG